MIELRRRQWIIDQTHRILFRGEVHYFGLVRRDWRARLLDLRAAGAQAVATYIPGSSTSCPTPRSTSPAAAPSGAT